MLTTIEFNNQGMWGEGGGGGGVHNELISSFLYRQMNLLSY